MSTEPPGLRGAPTSGSHDLTAVDRPTTTTSVPASGPGGEPAVRRRRPPEPAASPGRGKPPPRRKRKARRVHRVVRHLDVWSVTKLAAAFVACGYVVAMVSGYLLWRAADRVGTIDGIEGFLEDSASYDTFTINGGVVFRVAAVSGIVLAIVTVSVIVLGALLFNLISDLTGGVRMTVIDEDLIVAPARRPRPEADPARRPEADPARRPEADPARRPEAIRPAGPRQIRPAGPRTTRRHRTETVAAGLDPSASC